MCISDGMREGGEVWAFLQFKAVLQGAGLSLLGKTICTVIFFPSVMNTPEMFTSTWVQCHPHTVQFLTSYCCSSLPKI